MNIDEAIEFFSLLLPRQMDGIARGTFMHQLLGSVSRRVPSGSFLDTPAWNEDQALPRHAGDPAIIYLVLIVLLLLSFAVQVLGVYHRNVNWDEFVFLANIYQVANGYAVGFLQTPYTHLFGWLTRIGGDEITKIILARFLYLLVWIASLAFLYRLGRRLLDPIGALASVVLFALFSYSVAHAASFRIDGLLLPVLLSIALLLTEPTTPRVAAAGALSGVALALTVKAILWAPAFAGLVAAGSCERRKRLRPVLTGAIAGIVTLGGIMLVHYWLLSGPDGRARGASLQSLSGMGFGMLMEDGILPRFEVLTQSFLQNMVTWALVIVGFAMTIADLRLNTARRNALLLLALALPILSVFFYANAWPYAYLILMPTVCLLAGLAFSRLIGPGRGVRSLAAAVCLATAGLPLVFSAWALRTDQQEPQKQILSIVHVLFEEPVPYIDRGGMISSFPRQPIFMSRWGMKRYHEASLSVLASFIRSAHPPLLIVNTPALDVWDKSEIEQLHPRSRLLAKDVEALRAAYTPYWGPIYLAGRHWRNLPGGENRSFEIVIPGAYTLIADHEVALDGRLYKPSATLTLEAGPHVLRTVMAESDLRLLWGRGTTIPAEEPSPLPIYTGL
jgi:hypothetical protein